MSEINERMQAKGTKSRPELHGSIEKGGHFALAVTSRVFRAFKRTTKLTATASRDGGATVITGSVPDGVTPPWQRITLVLLLAVGGLIVLSGQPMLALVVLLMGGLAFIPMIGDYNNSETLLIEVEKILKASPRPPRKK
jgi:hypothetical protein